MNDEIDINTATQLPRQPIDAAWRYTRGDNADDPDRDAAEVVADYEVADVNVDSGLTIIGRVHRDDAVDRDARAKMGLKAS